MIDGLCVCVCIRTAIETIDRLTEVLDLTDYSSLIIHPLVRVLDQSHSLQTVCMDALAAMAAQLGIRYNIFVPMVHRVTVRHRIHHQRYEILMTRLLQVWPLASCCLPLSALSWVLSLSFSSSHWLMVLAGAGYCVLWVV